MEENKPIKHCWKCRKEFTGWSFAEDCPRIPILEERPIRCAECHLPDPEKRAQWIEFLEKRKQERELGKKPTYEFFEDQE